MKGSRKIKFAEVRAKYVMYSSRSEWTKPPPIKYDPQIISQEPDSGIYALLRQAAMAGLFRGFCERRPTEDMIYPNVA